MTFTRLIVIAGTLTALAACTDAKRESAGATFRDKAADITCWSYGTEIYSGRSTGRVSSRRGDRIGFVDAANGRYTTVDGHCRIVYDR